MKTVSVIDETLVQPFVYWNQGICKGMCLNSELHKHVRSYSLTERLNAYAFACEQAETGIIVCVTVSNNAYCVWVNLRSIATIASECLG